MHALALLAFVEAAPHPFVRPPAEVIFDVALAPVSSPDRLAPPPIPALAHVARKAAPPGARAPAPARLLEPSALEEGVSTTGEAIGEGELAGAAVAGGAGAGGGCDMAGQLQAALRRDRRVQAELARVVGAGARALRIWNGDWIAHAGQEGRGLAAVREAIVWEVGFAPPECRREAVAGLVRLVLHAEPGGEVDLALGTDAWRWSDLLRLGAGGSPG